MPQLLRSAQNVFGRWQFGERIRYRKRPHCEKKLFDAQRGRKSGFANALRARRCRRRCDGSPRLHALLGDRLIEERLLAEPYRSDVPSLA